MIQWLARAYSRRIVNINVNIAVAGVTAVVLASGVTHLAEVSGVTSKRALLFITFAADWVFDITIAVTLHWLANHWPRKWARSRQIIDRADTAIDASPPPSISLMRDVAAATQRTLDLAARIDQPGGPEARAGADAAGDRPAASSHTQAAGPAHPGPPASPPLPASAPSSRGVPTPAGSRAPSAPRPEECSPEPSFIRDTTTIQLQRLFLSPVFYAVAVTGQWALAKYAGWSAALAGLCSYTAAILITRAMHTVWLIRTDPRVWREWDEAFRVRQRNNAAEPAASGNRDSSGGA